MNFNSTRNLHVPYSLSKAIPLGLATDGGLFVPAYIPKIDLAAFPADLSYAVFAQKLLHTFFSDDLLDTHLLKMCEQAFNFPVSLTNINSNTYILELFHGPTLSFKDFGARFLAECLNTLSHKQHTTILVATSGDTGSAVASAFYQKNNLNVIILYPKGKVSKKQEQQLTCWDNNIHALAVKGTFDDCQRLVKAAFTDLRGQQDFNLSSANSINIGRLLPQITYYAYSSVQFLATHQHEAGYIIPTGNLGNATAAYIAKLMGFPLREIVITTNANHVLSDYLQTGVFTPRLSIHTLANAMDVGNPSNLERLQYLFPEFNNFKREVTAFSVSDAEIIEAISAYYTHYKKIICPHTATAAFARNKLSAAPWIIVATADASKFNEVIEPIIHCPVPIAPALQAMLTKQSSSIEVDPVLTEVKNVIAQCLSKK